MSVILRKRKNGDGTTSLILDIYDHGKRKYEFLKHLKLSNKSNPIDKQADKDNLEQAKRIAIKKAQELSANDYDMTTDAGKKAVVVEWMQSFIDKYSKKDKRNLQGALNRFIKFLAEDKLTGLTFGRLTDVIISDYRDYLSKYSKGEGASSYFQRFKKMVKEAYRRKLIAANPAADISKPKGEARQKPILTLDEIKLLAKTDTESDQVKKAFIFCCMTGLRWIEVVNLKWKEINIKGRSMTILQTKTDKEKTVPLNDACLKIIGTKKNDDETIFTLPTANGANKTLKAWVKRAGIEKGNVTWHVARHSFGTNIIYNGSDVVTAMNLLGHTSLKHTQRYVRSADELKQRATDKLNIDI